MLHEFLTSNRVELIDRCREKFAKRHGLSPAEYAVDHAVPLFLQQLVDTLRSEIKTVNRPGVQPERAPSPTAIGRTAALHGAALMRQGLSIGQVVHEYGDICQSVTDLAVEKKTALSSDEFRTLNRCLDDAIADAVTAFGAGHKDVTDDRAESLRLRLIRFGEEYLRLIDIAEVSYAAIKSGEVGVAGATGTLLSHTLEELRFSVERALPEIRLASTLVTVAGD
jgi:hypothetical protein